MPRGAHRSGDTVSMSEATRDGTLSRLLKFVVDGRKGVIAAILICIFFTALSNVASGMFIQYIITYVIEPSIVEHDITPYIHNLVVIMSIVGSIYIIGVVSTIIYTQLVAIHAQRIMANIRRTLFDKMETLPIRFFDTNTHGDIMSYYTNDVDALYQFLGQSLIQFCSVGLTLIFCAFMMLWNSIWLSIIVAISATIQIIFSQRMTRANRKAYSKQQTAIAETEGFCEEMMTGLKVVKVFTHEKKSLEDFDEKNNNLYTHMRRATIIGNTMMPVMNNIGNVMYVVTAAIAVVLFMYGSSLPNVNLQSIACIWNGNDLEPLSVAIIVSFLMYTRQFNVNFGNLSNQFSMSARALAGARRILNVLDLDSETDDGYVTLVNAVKDENGELHETEERTHLWAWKYPHKDGSITYTELKGDILIDDVDFGYVPEKIVLHDIEIYAHPGQKIAFVGATGAGKTTITNLLNRFYDIQDGKIRYDGININKIEKGSLRRSLAMVLQDTNLFTGTVRENIRYGRLDATDEEVEEAAKIANAYDFITRLPQGFDTMLTTDGGNLSQGQRQLLSIARAACADAPVIILDEATSSIDTRTEAIVQRGIDQLMAGRTVFVIAHRLSTVQNADAIMVLDHGRIIERGNHKQLIEKKGMYYQLYTGAFELE